MTDEGLIRQLETTSAIHDAIFRKPAVTSATADTTDWENCPQCGSGDIEGGNIQIEGKEAWQPVSCYVCGTSWTEVYEAKCRTNIERDTT